MNKKNNSLNPKLRTAAELSGIAGIGAAAGLAGPVAVGLGILLSPLVGGIVGWRRTKSRRLVARIGSSSLASGAAFLSFSIMAGAVYSQSPFMLKTQEASETLKSVLSLPNNTENLEVKVKTVKELANGKMAVYLDAEQQKQLKQKEETLKAIGELNTEVKSIKIEGVTQQNASSIAGRLKPIVSSPYYEGIPKELTASVTANYNAAIEEVAKLEKAKEIVAKKVKEAQNVADKKAKEAIEAKKLAEKEATEKKEDALKAEAVRESLKKQDQAAPKSKSANIGSQPTLGKKFNGYTIYYGSGGGMLTSQAPAYWNAKTKTVTFFSKRLNAQVQCQNQVIKVKNGGKWVATDQPLSCEFDKISPPTHAGVPPQVFVNEFNYGKIARGTQSSGGDLREKVALQ